MMRMIRRKAAFILILAALVLGPKALAQDISGASPAAKFVQDVGDRAIRVIADKSLSPAQRTKEYSAILNEAFDLKTIGKFVLGRTWNSITPAQQREYLKLFEANVIKIYGDRLSFYSGESFRVKSTRQETAQDAVVSSEIDHPNGQQPTSVDWRVRKQNGKFAIVDVVIEGVSQSVTQRQEYASIIERNGGDINPLLDLMRQRLKKNQNEQNQQNQPQNPQ